MAAPRNTLLVPRTSQLTRRARGRCSRATTSSSAASTCGPTYKTTGAERRAGRGSSVFRWKTRASRVDATLDYTGFYGPYIYPKLAGFGYSSETKGMHVYESRSVRDGVGAASTFKRHNQDNFVTVAVSPDDAVLPHDARPKPGEEFKPRLVSVDCRARHHADVLVSLPSGSPGLAAPDPRFSGYGKVKRDVLHVLAANELNRDTRERWIAWCDAREAAMKRHPFAQFGGVWSVGARTPTAREAVAGNLVRYLPPNPIVSTRRRRRGATPNHRHARRCASPKNIILDFLAPNSSFGDYNNMGGKVLVYKKSVMEVALEWVRAAVRRADECVKAL